MDRELPSGITAPETSLIKPLSESSQFLSLPPEIRLQISEEIVKPCVYEVMSGRVWERRPPKIHDYYYPGLCSCSVSDPDNEVLKFRNRKGLPGIVSTCSLLYQETALLPLKHYVFLFNHGSSFAKFYDTTTDEQRHEIRNISICFCSSGHRYPNEDEPFTLWSEALAVDRLKSFTGLRNLVIHMFFHYNLIALDMPEILQLAAEDDEIQALMSFRCLNLRSVTIKISPFFTTTRSNKPGIQPKCLRKVILGEDREETTDEKRTLDSRYKVEYLSH